jgi:hypothetical protein
MSVAAMTNVAFVRRADVPPLDEAPRTAAAIEQATGGTDASRNAVTSAINLIVTYIPTEVVTLYVAVVATLQGDGRCVTRPEWIAFYCFVVATPIFVWLLYAAKVRSAGKPLPASPRTWPLWEMVAATVAYAAWAFALPKSPFRYFDWYSPALAGVLVLIVTTLLGLLATIVPRTLPPQ